MSQTMRHPDLGDNVEVPDFAVEGYEQRGYVHVEDDEPAAEAEHDRPSPHPTPDTTSETADVPGSDDGHLAVTPTD